MARLLFLVAIADLITTTVCMASVVVLSVCVTLHYRCGTKAGEIHGIILQRFMVGSSFEYPEGGFCIIGKINCLCVHFYEPVMKVDHSQRLILSD